MDNLVFLQSECLYFNHIICVIKMNFIELWNRHHCAVIYGTIFKGQNQNKPTISRPDLIFGELEQNLHIPSGGRNSGATGSSHQFLKFWTDLRNWL